MYENDLDRINMNVYQCRDNDDPYKSLKNIRKDDKDF